MESAPMRVYKASSWWLAYASGKTDVRVEYANGSIYIGRMLSGLRHGQGRYTGVDGGYHYNGNWVTGM